MKPDQLILFLEAASGPVSKLNNEIARIVGYRTVENPDPNPARKMIWLDPNGERAIRIPNYTGSIDEAIALTAALAAPIAAGFVLRDGGAVAQLDDEPSVKGATPAIALCIAAVKSKMNKDDQDYHEEAV